MFVITNKTTYRLNKIYATK